MSVIRIRIPDSLHKYARELAKLEQISINQLIATAVAEKLSALRAEEYIQARAKRGSRRKFDRVLGKVKSRTPKPEDVLD